MTFVAELYGEFLKGYDEEKTTWIEDRMTKLEELKKFRYVSETKRNDLNVMQVGINHTVTGYNSNYDFFQKLFDQHRDAIFVFEVVPSDNVVEESKFFYNGLADMLKKRNMPLYKIDPRNYDFDKYTSDELDTHITRIPPALATGLVINSLISMYLDNNERSSNSINDSGVGKKMNRRNFLKLLGGLGGVLTYNTRFNTNLGRKVIESAPLLMKKDDITADDLKYNKYDKFGYSEFDWRNVCIAEGITKLYEVYPGQEIISIMGARHVDPIKHYLTDDASRLEKLWLYSPTFSRVGDKSIRKYDAPDWSLTEKIAY